MVFKNKIVVVTGGAQGIGAAVVQAFAQSGAQIIILDCHFIEKTGDNNIEAIQLDMSESAAVTQAIQYIENKYAVIDVLVNVAGILRPSKIIEQNDEDWLTTFAVNTHGVFYSCRQVAVGMVKRRQGCIINVSSNASYTPRLNMAAYSASKAALSQFTRCLALELAEYDIRCNIVSPGSTYTAMQQQLWTTANAEEHVINGSAQAYRVGIPLKRIAVPEDVANAVLFLASEQAKHITMHDLRVDGGATFDY